MHIHSSANVHVCMCIYRDNSFNTCPQKQIPKQHVKSRNYLIICEMFSGTNLTSFCEWSLPLVNPQQSEDKYFLNDMRKKADCFVDCFLIKNIQGKVEILYSLTGKIICLYVSITCNTLVSNSKHQLPLITTDFIIKVAN